MTAPSNTTPIFGLAAQLTTSNPLLNYQQVVFETDTGLQKIGDGVSSYNSLVYVEFTTYYTTVSGTNTYVCTFNFPQIKSYFVGLRLRVLFTNGCTGTSTINLNNFGAITIKKSVSTNVVTGDILAGAILDLTYDGSNFQLINTSVTPGTGTVTSVSGTADRITSTGGTTPVIDISTTFEALLEKISNKATDFTTLNNTLYPTTQAVENEINNKIAAFNPAIECFAATTSASDTSGFTYNNGVSGVGATFTGTANTPVTIDGQTFTILGQKLFVKDDTQSPSGAFNGVYYVTQLQTVLLPPIFTRALNYDQPSDINNTGVIPISNGTINGKTGWILIATVVTVGVTPITYQQYVYQPTTFLQVANNLSDLNNAATARTNLGVDASGTAEPRKIFAYQSVDVSHTGDLVETILCNLKIPANTLGANDQLEIISNIAKTGSAATATWTMYVGVNSNSLIAAKTVGLLIGNVFYQGFKRRLQNKNATNSQATMAVGTSYPSEETGSSATVSTPNYDCTVDQYVMITGKCGNSGDTVKLKDVQIFINKV